MPKNIEEKLSDAIFDLNYEKVTFLVEQVKQENNNIKQILSEALENANKTEVQKKEQKSLGKIEEIRRLLQEELENIAAASVVREDVETTASSQEVPMVGSGGSEPSLSSEDDDFSKLEGDKSDGSAGTSSDSNSNSPFEKINEESHETRIPVIETVEPEATVSVSEMPSVEIEGAESNNEQFDNLNKDNSTVSSSVSENIVSNSASEAGLLDDDEDDRDYYYSLDTEVDNYQEQNIQREVQVSDQLTEQTEQVANEDTLPEPTLPTINKQSSESNQKTTALNTKRYVVAASELAIAGIALGVAVAVYLEMLVVGAAVAVCCLIAATITYCYRPKSSLEDNEVEKVDVTQKSTPCCGR